jgi:hypothetical protein
MTVEAAPVAVRPLVGWPHEAEQGQTYLMTVDLRLAEGATWPYDQEEYPVYCMVGTGPTCSLRPLGTPGVVLHRYGGTYGPARFLLTALEPTEDSGLRLTLVNQWGVPILGMPLRMRIVSTSDLDRPDAGGRPVAMNTTGEAVATKVVVNFKPLPAQPRSDRRASIFHRIDRERFDDGDYMRFTMRLEESLEALYQLLPRPGFGVGPATIGAELELFLIDDQGHPLAKSQAILEDADDPRVTLELDRFSLKLNLDPVALAGRPFDVLGGQLAYAVGAVQRAAAHHSGRVAIVGILPTLRNEDLHRGAITDAPGYQALDWSLRRVRAEPFEIEIAGRDPEPLRVVRDNIVIKGANTSFQVHLRVDPDRFAATWNAAAIATAPALAAAGNSPLFLGRVLWEETRIALFEQAADDRDTPGRERRVSRVAFGTDWLRGSALDLFEEIVRYHEPLLPVLSGEDPLAVVRADGVPRLDELRLHQATVWRWNRAIYDSGYGGHLRIEMRPLPAGPTVVDMLANAAFLLGLTLALASDADRWTDSLPFARAHANFYDAARLGLEAELDWPHPGGPPERVGAAELVTRLLSDARRGLIDAGVDADEADWLLGVIGDRAASGQTGAVWQRQTLAALEGRSGREQALYELLEIYLKRSQDGQPVHTWPLVR